MAEGDRQASSRIFISYRREDSAGFVRALLGPLRQRFGSDRIFKDTDNIPPGEDFVDIIRRELESCKVLLAVIGSEWATVEDPRTRTRRLDNPNDYLRLEVATALKNEHVIVIPVLVDRAGMPRSEDLPEDLWLLARRNAIELSDNHWDTDVERLVRAIQGICNDPALEEEARGDPPLREPGEPVRSPTGDSGGFERLELKRRRQLAEHIAAARKAFELHDFEAVMAACESAIWLDPQEPDARDLAGRARAALDERQIREWLAEAEQALAKGELATASEAIDQALARNPTHTGAVKLRQDLLRARQERERSREVARLVAVEMKSARSRFEEEDFSAALSHVEDALALAPESQDALELKAQIVAARDELQRVRDLKRRAQQTVTAAQAEFAAGNRDAAVLRLEQFAPPHDLVARALADLRQQIEEARESARREKAARDAAEAAAELARREREEHAAREEAARLAAAAKARQEQIEHARREEAARLAAAAEDRRKKEEQARREAAARATQEEARRREEEARKREEQARRLEEALAEKLDKASKADDHEVALALLREALTLAPADSRIPAQIARREAAIQARRAQERRQAEESRRQAEEARRQEEARTREETLVRILTQARNEPVDEVAIDLLNEGLRIAPRDSRLQTLAGERTAALERKRLEALEKAAAQEAVRRDRERQAREQEARRKREEREERARRALEKNEEQARQNRERLAREAEEEHRPEPVTEDVSEWRPVSSKYLGAAAAVLIAIVAVGVWVAQRPESGAVRPAGDGIQEPAAPASSEGADATGAAPPASSSATATRGAAPPASPPAAATRGAAPPATSPATAARGTLSSSPPATATRGTASSASPPTTTTRGTAPPSSPTTGARGRTVPSTSPPATATRGGPQLVSPPPESVTAVAVPAAGPPAAATTGGTTPPVTPPPTTGTPGATTPVGSGLAAERSAIQQLLDRYVTAYSRMDEQSLKAIDPSFRGIARRELIKSVTLTLGQSAIDVSPDGQSARLRATGDFRYVWNRAGLPATSPAQWTWNLRKIGTTWTIVP